MTKGTVFTTTVDSVSYQYVTKFRSLQLHHVAVFYKFSSVPVYEGSLVTFKYTVDVMMLTKNLLYQVQMQTLQLYQVKVQESSSDTTTNTYSLAGGYNNVTATSKVYFIQEGQDGKDMKFILVTV